MSASGTSYELVLANGRRLKVGPGDASTAVAVDRFAAVMGLRRCGGEPQIRFVLTPYPKRSSRNEDFYPIPDGSGPEGLYAQLLWMSEALARKVHELGGLFLHAGLAERDGRGVVLAAPGGRGKTTASRRFPPPWRSLSDDQSLVVFGPTGPIAHPWPTWSRFLDGGEGGAWDVSRAVALAGIFFLLQDSEDAVEPAGGGEAAAMLMESTEQASIFPRRGLPGKELRKLRMERFDSACRLVADVPAFKLRLTLSGAFWVEIGKALRKPIGSSSVPSYVANC